MMDPSSSSASVYKTKVIDFFGRKVPIILQNGNGPCALIAICNVLSLKNNLELNPNMPEVSEEKLLALVAERIHSNSKIDNKDEQTIRRAIALLPKLATGIDMNIKFRRKDDFEFTSACAIFDLLDIQLYHGWIPQEIETKNAIGSKSYDDLMVEIASLQIQDKEYEQIENLEGEVVHAEQVDCGCIEQGNLIRNFRDSNATQLTAYGLSCLRNELKERELCVFFRNDQFNTMFKYKGELYILASQEASIDQPDLVWEKLSEMLEEGNVRKAYIFFKLYALAYEKWDRSNQSLGLHGSGTKEVEWFTAQAHSMLEIAKRKHAKLSVVVDLLEDIRLHLFWDLEPDVREKIKALEVHQKVWVEHVDEVKAVAFLKVRSACTLSIDPSNPCATCTVDIYTRDPRVSTALGDIEHQMTTAPSDPNARRAFEDFCQALAPYKAGKKKHTRLMVKEDKAKDALKRAVKDYHAVCDRVEFYRGMASQKRENSDYMECFSQELLKFNDLFLDEVMEVAALNHLIDQNKDDYRGTIHPADDEIRKKLNIDPALICKCEPIIPFSTKNPGPSMLNSELPESVFTMYHPSELPAPFIPGAPSKMLMIVGYFVNNHKASSEPAKSDQQQPVSS